MKRKNTFERFMIENGSKQPLMCPLKKSNDYKIREKIFNKIKVMGAGRKMVVKLVEMKRKQNEIRKEHEVKDKLESLGQNAAKKTTLNL